MIKRAMKALLGVIRGNLAAVVLSLTFGSIGAIATQVPGFYVNNVLYDVPSTTVHLVGGPASSVSGDVACYNGTPGDEVADCGGSHYIAVSKTGVNFNSANSDNAIAIALPPGYTRYLAQQLYISNASQTLTTATFGLFTATGGGGTALISAGTAITVNTASDGTNNNTQLVTITNSNTESYLVANFGTLYFRVGTAQGAAATGNVTIALRLLP